MKRFLRACAVSIALLTAAPVAGSAIQPQPPKEFVPVEEIPPGEQIPAINLVAAAYGFIWLAVLGYVWSINRRLRQVESEIADLEARRK